MDEECLFPEGSDKTLLDKLHRNFSSHIHYQKPPDPISKEKFVIKHYAGDVTYNINGFLDKNRDTLFHDLVQLCLNSGNPLMKELFSSEYDSNNYMIPTKGGKKRPVTAGFQFKNSMQTLLTALYSCQPHYIRCIKPNDDKKALQFHDMKVIEQTRYLGILENLRVRRAGYCYRQTYEKWFNRYYMLSDKTFPKSKIGDNFKKGIEFLIEQLGLPKSEYQYGKTCRFLK